MKLTAAAVLSLSILLAARAGDAAPLCLEVQGIPPQCVFADAPQCERDARRQGGRCILNPAESLPALGKGAYCAAESGFLACVYADRASCAAGGSNRVCVPALAKPYPIIDPYDAARPYY